MEGKKTAMKAAPSKTKTHWSKTLALHLSGVPQLNQEGTTDERNSEVTQRIYRAFDFI